MLLGIEIGGTKLQLGLGAGDGTIARLVRRDVDAARGATRIREQIVEAARSIGERFSAVGIGFGGPVDVARGVVAKSHQVEGWDGFPIAEWAREALGVPRVAVANDADAAALGEARFGAGRGLSPVLYVNSGSGIGGGLIVDGAIYRGSGLGAIEIGHMVVPPGQFDEVLDGVPLEQVASGWAIAAQGRRYAASERDRGRESGGLLLRSGGDPSKVTAEMVAEAARDCPEGVAGRIFRDAARAMGQALAHAITLLAPRRVILGGGVSLAHPGLWLEPIRRVVDERVFPPFRGTFDLVTAELGEAVVVQGALALAR